jgi:hypothetical protein
LNLGLSFIEFVIYVIPMVLCIREIGRLWFKGPYVLQVFLGLCIVGSAISPLYFWRVNYVRPALFTVFVTGAILFVFALPAYIRLGVSRGLNIRFLKQFRPHFFIYMFTFIMFSNLQSRSFVFENHDVLYFGWMQEAWKSDYSGPIRVPTAYPNLMSANHLMPGALLSTLGALLPNMNLVKAIDLRYITVCFVLACLAVEVFRRKREHFFKVVLVGITLNLFYGSEIAAELNLSSFVYVILLGILMFVLFQPETVEKKQQLVILFGFIVIAKAPILLIAGAVLIYLITRNLKESLSLKNCLVFALIVANVWSWSSTPKPTGLGSGFPKPLGFISADGIQFRWESIQYNEILGWYTGHEAWFIARYIQEPYIFGIVIFLIIFKIYFVYFYFRKKIGLSSTSVSILDLYMLVNLLSWLLLRNNGSIAHQAHAYLLASTITFIVAVAYFASRLNYRKLIPLFLISVLIQFPTKYFPLFQHDLDVRLGDVGTITLIQLEERGISASDPLRKKQVYYSMLGERFQFSGKDDNYASPVNMFIQIEK